jgi:hypothetical protein
MTGGSVISVPPACRWRWPGVRTQLGSGGIEARDPVIFDS